jgi:hypothetical protein
VNSQIESQSTEEARVMQAADGSVVTTSSMGEISFDTTAGRVYVLERRATPFSTFEYAHIGAERNEGMKDLPGTSCELSIGGKPKPDTGKYEAEKGTLDMCSTSGDSAASGFTEVTGLVLGASVTFSSVRAGTSLDITYCTMNNPAQLSLYVDGTHNQDVVFPSTNSWSGHYEVKKVTVTIPQAATLKLQVDAGDSGANLDFIQVKLGPAASYSTSPVFLGYCRPRHGYHGRLSVVREPPHGAGGPV